MKSRFSLSTVLSLFLLLVISHRSTHAEPGPGSSDSSAAADIRNWAAQPADGPEGRPLPLTGSWNIGRYYQTPWKKGKNHPEPQAWDPTYFTELIQQGRHVLPTFPDPMTRDGPGEKLHLLDVDFEPALKSCAEHGLPIAFRDWNLADKVAQYETNRDQTFSNKETVHFIKNGKQKNRMASPISPVERWREFGRAWGGSDWFDEMAKTYPNPPMVVFLNNNEAGEVRLKHLDENATRFQNRYGNNLSKKRKKEIIHEGYRKRYRALFDTARSAAPGGWQDAMTYVAYNAFPWPKLRGVTPLQVKKENLPDRFAEWSYHDGAMPENYMNDWQVGRGKTDFSSWSPQAEATTYVPLANAIFDTHPNYYFASIGWEGGPPAKRGSPANAYATGDFGGGAVKKWDTDRYMGMLQFGLWAMRPRVFREFRGGSTRDAYYQKTWNVYMDIVDRVWERMQLQPFWRRGTLVENPDIRWQPGNADRMQLERWYLLHSKENPSPEQWPQIWKRDTTKLRVFALALKLGQKPKRRWMIYAHAPLGAVRNAHVTLPGYGDLTLDTVSRRGSFYIVDEEADTIEQVIKGGPPVIDVSASNRFVETGHELTVDARVTCPPDEEFTGFRWILQGKQGAQRSDRLTPQTLQLNNRGKHTIQVTGTTESGETVTAETTVWVGDRPEKNVVYDLSLDGASTWSGPWQAIGTEWPGELQRYRLVPNPGSATDPVLHGGTFVNDPERGRVLKLDAGEPDGLWGERTTRTVNHENGHPNKTISLRFKARNVQKRQVLYAEGHKNAGFNIYLNNDSLHAGGWGVKEKFGSWNGNWIHTDSIRANQWHRVTLVLKDGTNEVKPNRLNLFLDGKKIATGPGKRLPNHHSAPRLGVARSTRFPDGTASHNHAFGGLVDDFELINAGRPPEQD